MKMFLLALIIPVVSLNSFRQSNGRFQLSDLEGFAAAKVLVEGLQRAGRNPTRASFISAMESLRDYDLGGIKLTYGPNDHSGLDYVEASIVNRKGTFTQ